MNRNRTPRIWIGSGWLDSTNSGIEFNVLRPLQDDQRRRSHDHDSRTSLCNRPKPTRAGAYSHVFGCGTGLRISECLELQWQDLNFAEAMIHVRRTWTCGQVGLPKTKASKGPVPLHPLLAEFMLRWKRRPPIRSQATGSWVHLSSVTVPKLTRDGSCSSSAPSNVRAARAAQSVGEGDSTPTGLNQRLQDAE